MLAEVPLKILGLPFCGEPTDVDVGVVSLLESLFAGNKMLSLEVRTVKNLGCLSSDGVDSLLSLFGIAELDKAIAFAQLLALFGLVADLHALDLSELGEVLLKLRWEHRRVDVLDNDVAGDVHEVAVVQHGTDVVVVEHGVTLLLDCLTCRLLLIKLNNCRGFTFRPGFLVFDQADVAYLPVGFKEVVKLSLSHVYRQVGNVNRCFIL